MSVFFHTARVVKHLPAYHYLIISSFHYFSFNVPKNLDFGIQMQKRVNANSWHIKRHNIHG